MDTSAQPRDSPTDRTRGAGAAAFSAAIQAVERGTRVGTIEHGTIDGTCVNVGCVPSTAMLRAGEIYSLAGRNMHRGVPTFAGPVALSELAAQKDELVERLRQEKYRDLVEEYGWDFVTGHAEFADGETLLVEGAPLRARADQATSSVHSNVETEFASRSSPSTWSDISARTSSHSQGSGFIHPRSRRLMHSSRLTLAARDSRLL